MPPKKKPQPKQSKGSVEIVELASSSPGRVSRRSGAALEKELAVRHQSVAGLPPAPERRVVPDPTPNRFESTAEAYCVTADASAPARAARRTLFSLLSTDKNNDDGGAMADDRVKWSPPLRTAPDVAVRPATSSTPLSSELILGIHTHQQSSLLQEGGDGGGVGEAIKVAESLPSIAQALFLFANLHWSQIGYAHDAAPPSTAPLQPRGNFYVINGSSTERGGGRIASVPPSPGKPLLLSPPPTPTKGDKGAIAGKENISEARSESVPRCSVLGSVAIDDRLLGAVGNRCPFAVSRDHIEQAAALFPTQLRTDWTNLVAPRLCFLGQQGAGFPVPSTNTLRLSMLDRYGSLEAVARKVVLVTSASLAEALRRQHGPRVPGGSSSNTRPGTTADLLASIRKTRPTTQPPSKGGETALGGLSSRIGAAQDTSGVSTKSSMQLLLQSVSSALNSQTGAPLGSKRPREGEQDEGSTSWVAAPQIPASLLAALPQDKLQEVVSAASVEHLYSAHDLSRRLQRQINLERTLELFDLVCAVFGPSRSSMSGGRLVQQLAAQNSNGDNRETIKEQLATLVRLGPNGSGLSATNESLVGILVRGGDDNGGVADGEQDLNDRLVVLSRQGIDRKMLQRAIEATLE